jgi:two-component system phosphate regulon response regulator PhoB
MSKGSVVVIEDEADIREVILYNLSREGYAVTGCANGEEGIDRVRDGSPNLVVLDLMLPKLDGVEVCRRLKADPRTKNIPVIMVTAKGEESDIVLGLGVGADDFITKPFKTKELVARVSAVLRRGPLRNDIDPTERIVKDGLVIDASRHEVTVDGEPVVFTATEFRLLHYMARHPGRVFTREQLISQVIGDDAIILDRNIDVHIRALRKKIGDRYDLIETIRGVGYRFRERA